MRRSQEKEDGVLEQTFLSAMFFLPRPTPLWINTDLSKTAEDGDGNVVKTIRLITQDKKRT